MNKSVSIIELANALAKAQGEMPKVKMNAVNPFLKNKYADLGAVIETSKPILAKYGLSLAQFPVSQEGRIGITSILMHGGGQFIEETITLVPENAKGLSINQTAGVTISYLRRYAWASILGLYADEDVDGDVQTGATSENAATDESVKKAMSRNWKSAQTEAISIAALDAGLEAMTAEDASFVLDLSALPENAPVATIGSWFKHYVKSDGQTPLLKAADANEAYAKAKKSTGGK
jgi:ERF superfamily.